MASRSTSGRAASGRKTAPKKTSPRKKTVTRKGSKTSRSRTSRKGGSGGGPSRWVPVVLLLLVVAGLSYWTGRRQGAADPEATSPAAELETQAAEEAPTPQRKASPKQPSARTEPPAQTVSSVPGPGAQTAAPPAATRPLSGGGARIALVIDDLGRSLQDLDTLDRLGVPLTYAVLPFETLTDRVAARLRERRAEILLHLPMEPGGGANPGPGALRGGMSTAELVAATRRALEAVPGALGVNNHMGSSLSADRPAMEAVLALLAERDLFFLDSRTSAASVAYDTALSLGIPTAQRQVFLDRDPDPAAIREQFRRLEAVARQRGSAIAIGHPYPSTLAVLAQEVPVAKRNGFEFVPVSYLLERAGGPPL